MGSLANYNFQLHYRAGKANIDADALSRVFWPGCVTYPKGIYHQVTTAAVEEVTLESPLSPIEAYSYDLHVLDQMDSSWLVSCMTAKTDDRPN